MPEGRIGGRGLEIGTVMTKPNLPRWRRLAVLLTGFLGLLAALATILALIVTVAEGWQEHVQAQWPEVTAQVQRCSLDVYPSNSSYYWIDCGIRYEVLGESILSHVHSRTTPAPGRWVSQYPAGQLDRMRVWVDAHAAGTPIKVRYDPAHAEQSVLVTSYMPRGGPRTPNNLKLIGICAVSCVVLLTIARIVRPTPASD